MTNKKITCGIDTGFGYCISYTDKKLYKMRNYIQKIPKASALDIAKQIKEVNDKNILIKYENNYYICGDLCLTYYPDTIQRLDRNRVENVYHLIELLSLAGLQYSDSEFNLDLCVGVPNRAKKDMIDMKEWLSNIWEFSYLCSMGEIKKQITIENVACIPQVLAPIFTLPENIRENKLVLSIDLGHSSSDFLLANKMKLVKRPGAMIDAEGVVRCYRTLKDMLIEHYSKTKYKITDYSSLQLQEIIETEKYILNDEEQDITDTLDYVFEQYADYIFYQVENNMADFLSTVDAFIVSGGIMNNAKFKEMLSQRFIDAYGKPFFAAKDAQSIIANGLYLYSNMKYGQSNASNVITSQSDIVKKEIAVTNTQNSKHERKDNK